MTYVKLQKKQKLLKLTTGLHRTAIIAAISCGLANMMWAARGGFDFSWFHLSSGWIVKKKIAIWMVEAGLGKLLSDIPFTIFHSVIMSLIAYGCFNITVEAIAWVVSGFLGEAEHKLIPKEDKE